MAARNGGPVDLSPSTIYRWVAAGYDGMTNMELRRKVGYRPRKRAAGRAATRHSARRSHAAFLALGEDACAAICSGDSPRRRQSLIASSLAAAAGSSASIPRLDETRTESAHSCAARAS